MGASHGTEVETQRLSLLPERLRTPCARANNRTGARSELEAAAHLPHTACAGTAPQLCRRHAGSCSLFAVTADRPAGTTHSSLPTDTARTHAAGASCCLEDGRCGPRPAWPCRPPWTLQRRANGTDFVRGVCGEGGRTGRWLGCRGHSWSRSLF